MQLLKLLVTILNRNQEVEEKKPWDKDNSWLIKSQIMPEFVVKKIESKNFYNDERISTSISDIFFKSTQVYFKPMYGIENLNIAITDISFIVTKTGNNPL